MDADLAKILRKKKWTGADAGRAFVANRLNDFRNYDQGRGVSAAFPYEKFLEKLETLSTQEDAVVYSAFLNLSAAYAQHHAFMLSVRTQFEHGMSQYEALLDRFRTAEAHQEERCTRPLIVSKDQYADLKHAAAARLEAQVESYNAAFRAALAYWWTRKASAPADLRAMLKTAAKTALTHPGAKEALAYSLHMGAYALEDGSREDKMPPQAWKARKDEALAALLKKEGAELKEGEDLEERRREREQVANCRILCLLGEGLEAMNAAHLKACGREMVEGEAENLAFIMRRRVQGNQAETGQEEEAYTRLRLMVGMPREERWIPFRAGEVSLTVKDALNALDILLPYGNDAAHDSFRAAFPGISHAVDAALAPHVAAFGPGFIRGEYGVPAGELAKAGVPGVKQAVKPDKFDILEQAGAADECADIAILEGTSAAYEDMPPAVELKTPRMLTEAERDKARRKARAAEILLSCTLEAIRRSNMLMQLLKDIYKVPGADALIYSIDEREARLKELCRRIAELSIIDPYAYGQIFDTGKTWGRKPTSAGLQAVKAHIFKIGPTAAAQSVLSFSQYLSTLAEYQE